MNDTIVSLGNGDFFILRKSGVELKKQADAVHESGLGWDNPPVDPQRECLGINMEEFEQKPEVAEKLRAMLRS